MKYRVRSERREKIEVLENEQKGLNISLREIENQINNIQKEDTNYKEKILLFQMQRDELQYKLEKNSSEMNVLYLDEMTDKQRITNLDVKQRMSLMKEKVLIKSMQYEKIKRQENAYQLKKKQNELKMLRIKTQNGEISIEEAKEKEAEIKKIIKYHNEQMEVPTKHIIESLCEYKEVTGNSIDILHSDWGDISYKVQTIIDETLENKLGLTMEYINKQNERKNIHNNLNSSKENVGELYEDFFDRLENNQIQNKKTQANKTYPQREENNIVNKKTEDTKHIKLKINPQKTNQKTEQLDNEEIVKQDIERFKQFVKDTIQKVRAENLEKARFQLKEDRQERLERENLEFKDKGRGGRLM